MSVSYIFTSSDNLNQFARKPDSSGTGPITPLLIKTSCQLYGKSRLKSSFFYIIYSEFYLLTVYSQSFPLIFRTNPIFQHFVYNLLKSCFFLSEVLFKNPCFMRKTKIRTRMSVPVDRLLPFWTFQSIISTFFRLFTLITKCMCTLSTGLSTFQRNLVGFSFSSFFTFPVFSGII